MKYLSLIPALLAAACTENLPAEDQVVTAAEGDHDGDPDVPAEVRAFTAGIAINPITCDSTIAQYEAFARYSDDNSPVANIACTWTFDDGATSNECIGEHPFANAGAHVFELQVTDLSTGGVSTALQTRQFHPPIAPSLEVTSSGMTISYKAMTNTGGEQHVSITPAELVLGADVNDLDHTVTVSQPGTYTITYDVEDERGVGEICNAQVTKTVIISGDGHDGCEDPDHGDGMHMH